MQIHVLSDFLVVITSLDLKVLNVNPSTSTWCTPSYNRRDLWGKSYDVAIQIIPLWETFCMKSFISQGITNRNFDSF